MTQGLAPRGWIAIVGLAVVLGGVLISYGTNKVTRSDVRDIVEVESPYVADRSRLHADHDRYDKWIEQSAVEHREIRTMFAQTMVELKGISTKLEGRRRGP